MFSITITIIQLSIHYAFMFFARTVIIAFVVWSKNQVNVSQFLSIRFWWYVHGGNGVMTLLVPSHFTQDQLFLCIFILLMFAVLSWNEIKWVQFHIMITWLDLTWREEDELQLAWYFGLCLFLSSSHNGSADYTTQDRWFISDIPNFSSKMHTPHHNHHFANWNCHMWEIHNFTIHPFREQFGSCIQCIIAIMGNIHIGICSAWWGYVHIYVEMEWLMNYSLLGLWRLF